MQRLFKWLGSRFFPGDTVVEKRQPRQVARAIPRTRSKVPPKRKPTRYSSEIGGKIEDGGPGKNVLVRNKYLREDSDSKDGLNLLDDVNSEADDGSGIDPYNTGRFDRSKSWDSFRNRK